MNETIISKIKSDEKYKSLIIDSLCYGLDESLDLRNLLNYVIEEKFNLFDIEEFQGTFYPDDDNTLDLVLPAVRRVWGKVFIYTPTLLKEKKLELFKLLFDIDDFIDYLINIIPKVKTSLSEFDKLDRTVETLSLVVDNYIADLVEKTRNIKDIDVEIRDLRLRKTLKKW